MGFGSLYLVFGAAEVAEASKDKALGRSATAKLFEPLFGKSLIENDGEIWKQQRSYLSKSINIDRRKEMHKGYSRFSKNAIADAKIIYKQDGCADIQFIIYKYVSDCLSTAFFGQRLSDSDVSKVVEAWGQSLDHMSERLSSILPLPMFVPTPNNIRLQRQANIIDGILKKLIKSSSSKDSSQGCLRYILQHISQSDPDKMTGEQVFKELRAAYLAALDNTSTSITWLIYNLAHDLSLQDEIRKEVLASNTDDYDSLAKPMPLLESAFNESVRLSPPLWIVDRTATEDTTLGGYLIPKGATLIISPYITQRDPRYWNDPLTFIPGRFVDTNVNTDYRYTFFPFGIGKFKCPGISLSMILAKLFVSDILKNHQIGIYPWNDSKFDRGLVYRTGELNVTFSEHPGAREDSSDANDQEPTDKVSSHGC
jgi:cytochrome P450